MQQHPLIGVTVVHEYRGRGVVTAVEKGAVTVRFGEDYFLSFPYPAEFDRMLTLKEYDYDLRSRIESDLQADRLARAEAYRSARKERQT